MMISFLGVRTDRRRVRQTEGQTDTVLESSYGNMSAHKKFQLKAQNQWLAVDPYMPPRRSGMHKYMSLCALSKKEMCNRHRHPVM